MDLQRAGIILGLSIKSRHNLYIHEYLYSKNI